MSLSESRLSKETFENYRNFCTSKTNDSQSYDERAFIDIWQKSLDDEFQRASQTHMNFIITDIKGSLYIPLSKNGVQLCLNIAMAVCSYWSKALTPGKPEHLDSVVSVTNDAMTHVTPLYSDIMSIRRSTPTTEYYKEIHDKILTHVKSIKWIVVEMDASTGSTTEFIECVF